MGCPASPSFPCGSGGLSFSIVPSRGIDSAHVLARLHDGTKVGDAVRHTEHLSKPAEIIHQLLLAVVPGNKLICIELRKSHCEEGLVSVNIPFRKTGLKIC
ncbi:MAG: hypothetical protein RL213_864 [Bacteroidota bacterium]